ncbi:MAG: DUF3488 and transglutaminase-like domain-containing protein [Blastocatellia bacterium]|nr:DUF3488 and transglutaminase-like domain-containing protein [Blastocatellia bacterium]
MEKFFKSVSYTLIGTGFATLAVTGHLDAFSILVYTIALILSWRSDVPGSNLQISATTANWLAILYLPFAYLDFRYLSPSGILVLIHFTLFVSIFKLFQNKEDRDWVFLYLLAVFEVLLAAGLTVDAVFVVMLIVFVLTGLIALEVFEIRKTRREARPNQAERAFSHDGAKLRKPVRPVLYLLVITGVMAVFILAIAFPFFFALPRFNTGFFGRSFGDSTVAMTGFSDVVQLGDVVNIKKSQQIVMYVRVKGGAVPGQRFRWHGVALTSFNGSSWGKPVDLRRMRVPTDAQGTFLLDKRSVAGGQPTLQTFFLEPMSSTVLFYAGRPLLVSNQLSFLSRDQTGTLYTADHSAQRITYTVTADTTIPSDDTCRRDPMRYSQEEQDRYLQLPSHFNPRIKELTQGIATAPTAFDKAREIEFYLKNNFGYSLNLKRTDEPDPIVDFLFNTKVGHCEYFATSMVLMLRSQGIAARIVNGFQSGEYNPVSESYVIHQSEAHSWVEVYFPATQSWVEFDPTPPAGTVQFSKSGWMAYVGQIVEAMRMFWIDYVVSYDASKQRSLAQDTQEKVSDYKSDYAHRFTEFKDRLVQSILHFDKRVLPLLRHQLMGAMVWLLAFALFTAALVIYLYRTLRRLRFAPESVFSMNVTKWFLLPLLYWVHRHHPQQFALLGYQEMLFFLARKGWKRAPGQTPFEFAQAIKLPEVMALTDYYYRIRFSGGNPHEFDLKRMKGLVDRVKDSIRRLGPPRNT